MIDRKLIRLIERGSVEYADVDVDTHLAVELYCEANGITSETIIDLAQQYSYIVELDPNRRSNYDKKLYNWIRSGRHSYVVDDYIEQMERELVPELRFGR